MSAARGGRRCRSGRGFTLVELMIVVGIIAILAAIGIPTFRKFQGKARQSEAKVSLKSYFTATKSIFAETSRWECGKCGWGPQDDNYMYNYFISDSVSFTLGDRGCDSSGLTVAKQTDPNTATGDPGGFTAGAAANLDTDIPCDGWNINDANSLTNLHDDVAM